MSPANIRQLRDIMRYCFNLTGFRSSEKNYVQNCLTVFKIQLGTLSRTPSENLPWQYWISFGKISQILPLTLNYLFLKV